MPSSASQELLAEINQHKPDQMTNGTLAATTKSSFVSKFGRKKSTTQPNLFGQMSTNGAGQSAGRVGVNEMSTNVGAGHGQTGFFKLLHESKWFDQIKTLLDVANMLCERMDDGSSVMVALEDGWDLTAQVVALAELMMDPYYRTIEGFCVLIEREWLSMGHR